MTGKPIRTRTDDPTGTQEKQPMQNLHVSLHRLRWGHWDLGRVEDLAWRVGQETGKHWFSRPEDAAGCPKYTCNTVACKKNYQKQILKNARSWNQRIQCDHTHAREVKSRWVAYSIKSSITLQWHHGLFSAFPKFRLLLIRSWTQLFHALCIANWWLAVSCVSWRSRVHQNCCFHTRPHKLPASFSNVYKWMLLLLLVGASNNLPGNESLFSLDVCMRFTVTVEV